MKPVAAEVRPMKQQARSESAHEIHDRLLRATASANSLWVHQAQAISDMCACEGWKDLGYESRAEWLTQPELNVQPDTARKLRWVFETFTEKGATLEQLSEVSPYALAITTKRVGDGEAEFERAIADAKSMHTEELKIRYGGDLGEELDADAEPEKWKCPTCLKVHGRMPKHLAEDEPEPDHRPADGVEKDEAF